MKYLAALFVFFFGFTSLSGQSVTVTVVDEHTGLTPQQVPLQTGAATLSAGRLTINNSTVSEPLSWSVSPEGNKIGVMNVTESVAYHLFNDRGINLTQTELEFFDTSDSSIAVFQFSDGRAVTRDNIANFTFFDAGGRQRFSISNSSGSSAGERISGLAADHAGKTIVLYNPVISYDSRTGSRAQLVHGEENSEEFFRSDNREIKQLKVTDDGLFISVLTTGGSNDRVHIFDRFGNELYSSDLESGRAGITLSGKGEFLTVYGAGRVQVFNTGTNQSVGSSSSQTPLLYGVYIPEDETILALGGNLSGETVSSASLIAVHVGKRQIARSDLPGTQVMRNSDDISLKRNSANSYRLKGLNQHFNIRTSF